MSSLHTHRKALVLDTETTGFPARRGSQPYNFHDFDDARMIELGYAVVDVLTGETVREVNLLVDHPEVTEITNTHIHGIEHETVRAHGVSVHTALECLFTDLEEVDVIVAHNLEFDAKIIKAEAFRAGRRDLVYAFRAKPAVCTMQWAARVFDWAKYPKLVELHDHLFDAPYEQTHRALDDVRACVKCYLVLMKKLK